MLYVLISWKIIRIKYFKYWYHYKVEHYSGIFCECKSLKNFDISGFNIKQNVDIFSMFVYCSDELIKHVQNKNKKFKNIYLKICF